MAGLSELLLWRYVAALALPCSLYVCKAGVRQTPGYLGDVVRVLNKQSKSQSAKESDYFVSWDVGASTPHSSL